MTNLIFNARKRYEIALEEYEKSKNNDQYTGTYLSMCAFDLQQSIEFFLKGFIELLGGEYRKNHDITTNLNVLESMNIEILEELEDVFEDIEKYGDIFTNWEAKSRYNNDFEPTERSLKKAIEICEKLDEFSYKLFDII